MNLRFTILMMVFWLGTSCVFAQNEDGFGHARQIEGGHFAIYYSSAVELDRLLAQLNVSHADEILSGQSVDRSSVQQALSSKVEVLFARASDILDLHVDSYKGSIKIFPV